MRNSSFVLPRRDFLRGGLAATLLFGRCASAAPSDTASDGLIDTNVWLGQWPVRRLSLDDPAALAAKLTGKGVTHAWVSSFEGVLGKDLGGVNARLAETCRQSPLFEPFGMVNLTLPRWEDDVEACASRHRMRGLRLLPGYHGYQLDDPRFTELLKLATQHRLPVQIVTSLEDQRTQNRLLRVAPVDVAPLPAALDLVPGARVMLLNWPAVAAGKPVLLTLQDTKVLFDIAMLEGIAGIETILAQLPLDRLCFGSFSPVFYFEAARLKLRESELTNEQKAAVTHTNALHFLAA